MAEHHDDDGGLIRTPKQLIIAGVLGLGVPLAIALLVAQLVTTSQTSTDAPPEMVAKRIQPVAKLEMAGAGASAVKPPEETYKTVCSACHDAGVAGAPKLGDKTAWASRISVGLPKLVQSAIKGKNAMPPKGGTSLSDEEFTRVVIYIANKSGANFKDPGAK